MTKTVRGIIRGRTIELTEDLGVPDDQQVAVQLTLIAARTEPWGAGILRTAGALADDTEWDAIMAEVQKGRRGERA